MPIYEYKCNSCGADFELIVNSDTVISCSECGSSELTKKFSTFGFSTGSVKPDCAPSCGAGYSNGCCGSGMCPGAH